MATAEQTLTPEMAAAFRAVMLDGVTRELEITKKVLAAIPDAKAQYKPDPHARTAWELAWHLSRVSQQSQHPPPRSACNLPPSDGLQVPVHLRGQLRRAVAGNSARDQRGLIVFEATWKPPRGAAFFIAQPRVVVPDIGRTSGRR
jgi:hypothetical protein